MAYEVELIDFFDWVYRITDPMSLANCSFFFFFLVNYILYPKFWSVWLLYLKILKFRFYSLKFENVRILYFDVSKLRFYH